MPLYHSATVLAWDYTSLGFYRQGLHVTAIEQGGNIAI